ncbi:predicted hydrolase [Pelotomaculum thermopropionicum SI]|uniref:Predicted hydrolase n=1 Tax=Pelotomaculum thermopropionicum (strain DSM 13744 / JCM 10971 / SI) TaxID=370438 RepID=A5CYL3_PELTS|nr:predicted hydrolase [Pelotomaculum thermopropionicum SI]
MPSRRIGGLMPKFKLVAVDMDDTLLSRDLKLTGRVREAVAAVRAAGVYFTISTGRMYRSALPFARELGLNIPLITYQGALVKNSHTGELVLYRPLPLARAREIIARIHELGYHLNGYLDDRLLVERDTPEGRRYAAMSGVEAEIVGDLLEYLDRDPIKVLTIAEEPLLDRLSAELTPLYRGKVHIVKSKPHFLEFSHPQATKGDALAYLAGCFGVKREEVMAVGDSYNDLEMLEYAGLGVAVANAREDVKKKAGYVTSAAYGDGVVEALEKFVL